MFSSNTSQVSGAAVDPQFNYVTMLLHGDGTNGAQNNTFLDASTNNFTITRNGSTTQGSFSPYGPNWSNFFVRSSSQYLTVPNPSGQFAFGTGAFTIECWVNLASMPSGTGYPASYWLFGGGPFNSDTGIDFYLNNTQIGFNLGFFSAPTAIGNHGMSVGVWYHVAVVRGGGSNQTVSIYVNGTRVATATGVTASADAATSGIAISAAEPSGATSGNFDGYISNHRVVKGTAVYDPTASTLTVPTAPLTAISGTSLLTCADNRFIDDSTNNFTVTINGNPTVQRFSPFAPPAAYSTATIGGSGYFPAGGSQGSTSTRPLAVPNNSAFNLSGDFTVELWHYGDSFTYDGGNNVVFLGADFTAGRNQQIGLNGANDRMGIYHPSTGFQTSSVVSRILGAWNHYAYVRSGSTVTFYFNGINVGSVTNSVTFQMENGAFGALGGYGGRPAGYLTDFRVSNGAVLYTTNFTPPSAPISATGSTTCLLSMTNGAIFDNAMMNDLETIGNAQISTSVVKFGTGSMLFDGNDCLSAPSNPIYRFGTGDYTIEAWVYPTAVRSSENTIFAVDITNGTFFGYNQTGLYVGSRGVAYDLVVSYTIQSNVWTYLAVSRQNGTARIFANGNLIGSGTVTRDCPQGPASVGDFPTALGNGVTGYIDDLRVTRGVARYTANFTPPTAAFPNN